MSEQEIRLVALDLDGTLLDSQKRLTARSLAALERAAAHGIVIVPTTGRFFDAIPEVLRAQPFLRYAITINGAQALDVQTGEVIYRAEMPWQLAVALMEYLESRGSLYDCYQDSWGWMTAAMMERVDEYVRDPIYREMIRTYRKPVPELKAFIRERGRGIQKVQAFPGDAAVRADLLQTLDKRFPGLVATTSIPENVEINAAAANKGQALLALAAHLGLRREQTMAFGDGSNDISMLRAAGVGVAMANASQAALDAADCTTASCDEDGVAQVLERLLAAEN